ncbi:MAG TPA: hypothetical protein VG693_02125, partial [Actinomycetes bacterium]|nr:hypothetical protein [Actinomycetes bacterium]
MTVAAVLAVLVVHNLGANLWVDERCYVPLNLATAGVLVVVSGVELSWGRAPVALPVAVLGAVA